MTTVAESIQKSRDIALAILNPSERDLEHGLELHRDAVVVESYGLGLMAPVDADAMTAAIDDAPRGPMHESGTRSV